MLWVYSDRLLVIPAENYLVDARRDPACVFPLATVRYYAFAFIPQNSPIFSSILGLFYTG